MSSLVSFLAAHQDTVTVMCLASTVLIVVALIVAWLYADKRR